MTEIELEEALGIPKRIQKVTTTPAKLRRQERKEMTIRLMLHSDLSITNIAKDVGISRNCLYKYWNDWKKTEEAIQIDRRWHRAREKLETLNPEKEFEGLTRVKIRMTPQKAEVTQEITSKETFTYNENITYTEQEKLAILDARRAINRKRSSAPRPNSLH